MFERLIITSGITVGLVFAWVAVQSLVRRSSRLESGADVLACRMCGADGSCSCGLKALASKTRNAKADDDETH